ncbi:TatD family deoxyribonuclease [Peribacillus cavernae]|uniref:TatD family deoxyribonuclease n=1 Tax=Peribacillus cavernae TaxID=1674310 RepID=A0A433HRI8_9BACI|nr:TatD family hydrolase [Peribacillus cavernae]MDQ0218770.1 TatD DNase family protein [Peribacillus cavernae]RUQ30981.1 TatD family deoxyribonuclease [Peribacillus cavernae]
MKIIDAHIHFDQYEKDKRDVILQEMNAAGIDYIISVSTNLESSIKNLALSKDDRRIKAAFGFHPEPPLPEKAVIDQLIQWIKENQGNMIAIGEVGLPYYARQASRSEMFPYESYVEILERFVTLAAELHKPIILHAVYDDAPVVCDLLEKHKIASAHFHWFKGDKQTMKRMIQNGYFISVTPDVIYEREIQELVKEYPLELMMVETDGPWPFEGPFSGQSTHPKMIQPSISKISELKNIAVKEVSEILYENTSQFYTL